MDSVVDAKRIDFSYASTITRLICAKSKQQSPAYATRQDPNVGTIVSAEVPAE